MGKINLIGGLPDFTLHATIVTRIGETNKTDGGRNYYSLDKGKTYHLFISHEECLKRFKEISKAKGSLYLRILRAKRLAEDSLHLECTKEERLILQGKIKQCEEILNRR